MQRACARRIAARWEGAKAERSGCGTDGNVEPMVCSPDGRHPQTTGRHGRSAAAAAPPPQQSPCHSRSMARATRPPTLSVILGCRAAAARKRRECSRGTGCEVKHSLLGCCTTIDAP
eukprot:365157-Chlamydomonas_euryale.AAC.13